MSKDKSKGITKETLVASLDRLAPLRLAESWDNVGVLVDAVKGPITKVLMTIDLDASILEEVLEAGAQAIIAYHPPIFSGLKTLRQGRLGEDVIVSAIAHGLLIYSPHTALDAVAGGVNDWLAGCLGELEKKRPIKPRSDDLLKLVVFVPEDSAVTLRQALSAIGCGVIGDYTQCSFNLAGQGTFFGGDGSKPQVGTAGTLETVSEIRMEMLCPSSSFSKAAAVIAKNHPYEEPAWEAYPLQAPKATSQEGAGRIVSLAQPRPLSEVVAHLKSSLGLSHLRVAAPLGDGQLVTKVALCPGAGGSLFEKMSGVDLYLTGEMRHHDVLAKNRQGSAVILTEHTRCERGYLATYAERLRQEVGEALTIIVSKRDDDPLQIW